jgi:DbpA RNA binding domain
MNTNDPAVKLTAQNDREKRLRDQVQQIIATQNLASQRQLIYAIAAELDISLLDCAAAMACFIETYPDKTHSDTISQPWGKPQNDHQKPLNQYNMRLVRYRLDIGSQHGVALDEIKKVLVEESGVDVKNIVNARIMDSCTLMDLPDEMPQEIFHHLKAVEIHGRKLDIRRVKPRNKKRGNFRHRQPRLDSMPSKKDAPDSLESPRQQ